MKRSQIVNTYDRGVPGKERFHFSMLSDASMAYIMAYHTAYVPTGIEVGSRLAYWFAPIQVKAGDQVVLYTGNGNYSTKPDESGQFTWHFFYWGQSKTILNSPRDAIVLLEVADWVTTLGSP